MLYEKQGELACPLAYATSILSGKWKPYIIWHLAEKGRPVRYAELKRQIPHSISDKVFSQQLKDLVRGGIITRTAHAAEENENVLQVEYSLTEAGSRLCIILYLLRDWGSAYGNFDSSDALLAHTKARDIGGKKRLYSYCRPEEICDGADVVIWMRAQNPVALA